MGEEPVRISEVSTAAKRTLGVNAGLGLRGESVGAGWPVCRRRAAIPVAVDSGALKRVARRAVCARAIRTGDPGTVEMAVSARVEWSDQASGLGSGV